MPLVPAPLCPTLVERDLELTALRDVLAEAGRGQARVVLVTGEAGIGKTRLLNELLAEAASCGWQTLVGLAGERDADFPFAPVVDALRQRLRSGQPTFEPTDDTVALLALLPELAGRLAAGVLDRSSELPPEQSKRRIFEAIATLFGRWADSRPLLVAFEDLHWADPTSLELLELLPRRLDGRPLLILGTARVEELSPALRHMVATLRRQRRLSEVSLDRLRPEGVQRMLEAILNRPVPLHWTMTCHARTNGNPFFVEELLSSAPLDAGGRPFDLPATPATVREAVIDRFHRLPPASTALAELAAVIGSRFDLSLLTELSGLLEAELSTALNSLLESGILVNDPEALGDRYAFRHALTRDAIHERLPVVRRRALHQRVGETLEATGAAAELGYHFAQARDWERALHYARAAGDGAYRLHATPEALVHYQRARDAAAALASRELGELCLLCGRLLGLLGAFNEAREQLERARVFAQAHADAALEQSACYELAGLHARDDYRYAHQLAEEALARAKQLHDARREGLALNRLGNVLTNLGRFDESVALHREALTLFEAGGDRWGVADALDLIGMTHYLAGETIPARTAFARAGELFADLDDPARLASALTTRGLYLAVLDGPCATDASPETYRLDAERGLQLCRAIAWRSGEAYAQVALGSVALGDAGISAALGHLDLALAIAAEIEHVQWAVIARMTRGLAYVELNDPTTAEAEFRTALALASSIGSTQWRDRAQGWLARCRLLLGDPDGAAELVEELIPAAGPPRSLAARRALCTRVELALARSDGAGALTDIDRCLAADETNYAPPAVLALRAQALAALDRRPAADQELERARDVATATGQRLQLWKIAGTRAALWRAHDPVLARREADVARAELASVAGRIENSELRTRFLTAPPVQVWIRPGDRSRTARTSGPGGLTARELDVARALASGLTNRAIAAQLSISERTVEMHVSNALAKLSFTLRAQLAAWAATHATATDQA